MCKALQISHEICDALLSRSPRSAWVEIAAWETFSGEKSVALPTERVG